MSESVILNEGSQRQWVRDIWKSGDARSIPVLAAECIAAGVFNEQDKEKAFFSQVKRFCLDTVRGERDEQDLPSSGPTGSKDDSDENIWAQRTFWDIPAYEFNTAERVKHGMGELRIAARLADECEERFGVRPAVPSI